MKSWFAILSVLAISSTVIAQQSPTMKLIADTVVDPAGWNFLDGRWGTTVNGQTFQQEGLVTHKGYQYAAYFADEGFLAVGRRKLPEGAWEVIHFMDYQAKDHRDAHNVATIGIAEGDGTIHMAFDHHVHPLHYRRSVQGLASRPGEFAWKAENFGPVTDTLEGIGQIERLTYPQMFASPGGKLQMLYRTGWSGCGDWHLVEYDPASGSKWSTIGTLFFREGDYQISPSRCAYPNPLRYDANGVLHVTWCWREAPRDLPQDLRTNHDLMYAYSEDAGRTWKNNAGNVIADITGTTVGQPKRITLDTMGTVIVPTKWLWGQMNTVTQTIDGKGRVHFMSWHLPPEAKEGTTDMNPWRFFHCWRDEQGTWHENRLPFVGRKPQMVLDKAGNALVVYCSTDDANYHGSDPGGKLTIMTATEASKWTDWKRATSIERLSVGEPLIDNARWASEGVLSVYLQDKPPAPGKPSALRVMDFR